MRYLLIAPLCFMLLSGHSFHLSAQEVTKSKPVWGVRYSTGYTTQVKKDQNYGAVHFMPVFTAEFNNSCFYLGPEYAYFLPPEPGGSIVYNKNGWGVNFGYRISSREFSSNLKVFCQFNYSIYQIRSRFFQSMGTRSFDKKLIFTELNLAIGLNYGLSRSVNLFSGFGTSLINSIGDQSAYLDWEPFVPTVLLGIDYKFGPR